MRYNDIKEGIRMGKRDLPIQLSRYTIGFEFEIAQLNDVLEFESPEPDIQQEEQFFEDYFNRNYFNDPYSLQEIIEGLELSPVTGQPTTEELEDYFEQEQEKQNHLLLDKYKNDEHIKQGLEFIKKFTANTDFEVVIKNKDILVPFLLKLGKNGIASWLNNYNRQASSLAEYQVYSTLLSLKITEKSESHYLKNKNGEIISIENIANFQQSGENGIDTFMRLYDVEFGVLMDFITENDSKYQDEYHDYFVNNDNYDLFGYLKKQLKNLSSYSESWKIVEDGTLGVDAEIVTPPMKAKSALICLKEVLQFIRRDENIGTNDSTGLHINFGDWKQNEWESIDWLKFMMVYDSKYALEIFNRIGNRYTVDQLENLVSGLSSDIFKDYQKNVKIINQIILENLRKYSSINFSKLKQHGFLEIRAPGNENYENRFREIVIQIQRLIRAVEIASDPNAYKNEYLTKLYRRSRTAKQQSEMNLKSWFEQYGLETGSVFDKIFDLYTYRRDLNPKISSKLYKELLPELKKDLETENPSRIKDLIRTLERSDDKTKRAILNVLKNYI